MSFISVKMCQEIRRQRPDKDQDGREAKPGSELEEATMGRIAGGAGEGRLRRSGLNRKSGVQTRRSVLVRPPELEANAFSVLKPALPYVTASPAGLKNPPLHQPNPSPHPPYPVFSGVFPCVRTSASRNWHSALRLDLLRGSGHGIRFP